MSDAEDESLFCAEYAKSGRSKCKLCTNNIEQEQLRLGVKVQSSKTDHRITSWYHLDCFFVRQRPNGTADISGFENLRSEDQTAVEDRISGKIIPELPEEVKEHVKDREERLKLRDYHVEYAKTGRSKCRKCVENIGQGDVRLSKRGYSPERAKMFGPQDRWYHVDCFVEKRKDLEFTEAAETIPGFDDLSEGDQKMLKEKLPELSADEQKKEEPQDEGEESKARKKNTEGKEEPKGTKETEGLEEPEEIEEPEAKKKKEETGQEERVTKTENEEIASEAEGVRAD